MDWSKYVVTCSGVQAGLQAAVTDCLSLHGTVWNIVRIIIYLLNFGTDSYASYRHYANGDIYWGTLTLFFVLLPIILIDIFVIYWEIYRVPKLLAPFIPFLLLVRAAVAAIRTKGIDTVDTRYAQARAATDAEGTAICVAGLQSLPQASLQLYIIARTLQGGYAVGLWQWTVVGTALVTIAATISTSTHIFVNVPGGTRVTFFLFGLMATFSRLIMCCIYSFMARPLALLPLVTFLTASIIMWVLKISTSLHIPEGHWITRGMIYISTWALTAFYNCFTPSGLLISTINFSFAIGAAVHWWSLYELWGPAPVAIATFYMLTITISGITFIVNVIFSDVPGFRCIGTHWLGKTEDNKTLLY